MTPRAILSYSSRCKCDDCKTARKAYKAAYYQANREKIRRQNKANYDAHPGRWRLGHFRYSYGLTLEERDALLADQQGRCAICASVMEKPCVDHDHKSGSVRGLLCHACNKTLAFAHDDPELLRHAAEYLERELADG